MEIEECIKKGFIKKTKVDKNLMKSLLEMSDVKEITVKNAKIDEINVSVYVSVAYDALREVLESISISKGYKILSHVCMAEMLKKLLKDFDYNEFDRIRWTRNSINYYGTKIDLNQGKKIIKKIFQIKKYMLNKYLSNFK